MNTATKTSSKLLIGETKALKTFDILPLVEASSSTARFEPKSVEISSKSSSPFNALAFKIFSKLSPLSELKISPSDISTAANCAGGTIIGDSNTKNLIKSPISIGIRSPIISPLLQFLNEPIPNTRQQIKKRDNSLKNHWEDMLSTPINSNHQPSAPNSSGGAPSSPSNSIKNIKCEPFSTLSPLNDSANSQTLVDETPKNIVSNSNSGAMDTNVKRDRDGSMNSALVPVTMIRQSSNGSIKSCTNTGNAASPNNGSDHSSSSNISQALDPATDILQDLNNPDKSGSEKNTNLNSLPLVKEEANGVKSFLDKSCNSLTGSSALNLLSTSNSLSTARDETDMNLVNVKKEEGDASPEISTAGFGSIAELSGNNCSGEVRSCTPGKVEEVSNSKAINNCNNNCMNSNDNDKLSAVLGSINNNEPNGSAKDSLSVSGPSSSLLNTSNDTCVGGKHHPPINLINNTNTSGFSVANCMEYMQQQNHIFVFSTQLANKGAELVLNDQFPTIIAYHCTQPATKNFLEDFFIKNPMKISKLQRQNTFSLCNAGQQWVPGCNSGPKTTQKSNGNKIFMGLSSNIENKPALRQSNIASFSDVPEALCVNEGDLMCWERAQSNPEEASSECTSTTLKTHNGADGAIRGSHAAGGSHVANNTLGAPDISAGNENGTPSLQGIKVPDENLTPQQRQHREEQLAKLKQIDQFLSNPLQGTNQLNKLGTDNVSVNLTGLIINLPGSSPAGIGSQISNSVNLNMRNMPTNVMNSSDQNVCNPENIPTALADGNVVSSSVVSAHERNNLACNTNKPMHLNNQLNKPCGSNGVSEAVAPNVSIENMPNSSLLCRSGGNSSGGGRGNCNIIAPGGLMPNSPEMISNFIGDGNLSSNEVKLMGSINSQEIGQVGMAQIEWSKLQHQFFEERIKNNKGQGVNDIGCMSTTLCPSNSSSVGNVILKSNTGATCASTTTTNSSHTIRSTQGPPPPYHHTQRSASVPIATQSPNPASPNNPTSNLSLPSPRTSGGFGIPAISPNMDVHVSTVSTALAITTTTSTVSTAISNGNIQAKNSFPPEGSPTNSGITSNSTTANNRNRSNQMSQFNSNPSTPLSHMSPKDLESFHASVQPGDLKNARPSPQRSRTPSIGPVNGNSADVGNMEGHFHPASPGLNFAHHIPNASNNIVNNYKGPAVNERQNSAPLSSHFCRRSDNMPLNPNSNRTGQNKLNHSFDPISSLAQMSQQLTSSASLNTGGVGNSSGVGNISVPGVSEVTVPHNINQNMDTIIGSMDAAIDHCSAASSGNMGMPPHLSGPSPFVSNNCHINSMFGSMGQRLLNAKMCGGYNPTNGGIGRDGLGGLHGAMPTHRMIGRMAINFGNFNVAPNIQVKASTPNTIQYMPVRPQSNNSSNMRIPPSLEFLRYTGPQIAGTGNIMDSNNIGQAIAAVPTDPSKMNNCNSDPGGTVASAMHFFGNCHQMGSMLGEQEDMAGGNISGHELNMVPHPAIIRGMRPIRQQHIGHSGNSLMAAPRMQISGATLMPAHFPHGPHDPMECVDTSVFSGNSSSGSGSLQGTTQSATIVPGQGQMYPGGNIQHKPIKSTGGSNICQNINSPIVGNNAQMTNANLLPSELNSSMQSAVSGPIIMGNNSNMVSNPIQVGNNTSPVGCGGNGSNVSSDVGNVCYKPFVGPASNDIKYAQQYHSFQQQLYATSTRSQQNMGNPNIGSNVSTNPTFFVNK